MSLGVKGLINENTTVTTESCTVVLNICAPHSIEPAS